MAIDTEITDGSKPFSAIGFVTANFSFFAEGGTGVMIAPDEMLTAAHLVWDTDTHVGASSVTVSPGRDEGKLPFGTISVSNWHLNQISGIFGGISLATSHSDYALLHLSQPVGFSTGTMRLDPTFTGGIVNVGGYPHDGTPFDGMQLTNISGVSATTDNINHILKYSPFGTFQGVTRELVGPGSSGGPLWYTNAAGVNNVVGLNSTLSTSTVNAAWITPDVQSQIVGWYLADHPSPAASALPAAEVALFDGAYYLIKNPDIMAAGADALQHFTTTGWIEHRNPDNFFDVTFYLQHNPDVARLGMDPLLHYAQFGWKEGRDPSASFSTNHYLSVNPDVKLAGLDPLQHYLQFGLAEHRPI